jgi:hypothetical protein
MTEAGKSPKNQSRDFPPSLENAKSAFPTFPLPDYCCYSFSEATAKQKQPQKTKPERSFPLPPLPVLFRLIFQLEKTEIKSA